MIQLSEDLIITNIIAAVERVTGITEQQILSISQKAPLVRARHIAIYFVEMYVPCEDKRHKEQHTKERKDLMALCDIGKFFNRDHSTICHAVSRIKKLIETDLEVRDIISRVADNLGITVQLPEMLCGDNPSSTFAAKPKYQKYKQQKQKPIEPPKENFSWRKPIPDRFSMLPKFSRV